MDGPANHGLTSPVSQGNKGEEMPPATERPCSGSQAEQEPVAEPVHEVPASEATNDETTRNATRRGTVAVPSTAITRLSNVCALTFPVPFPGWFLKPPARIDDLSAEPNDRQAAPSSSVRGCSSVRGATAARSSSVTRLQTAASSSNTLQLNSIPRMVRSLTPPARIDDLSAEPNDRQASTPEGEHSSASPTHPNFLEDTNMSAIQNSHSGAVPKVKLKSRKDMMDERKKVKEDMEIKCLIAEMEAVLATAELYEEQEARKRSADELKVEEIKSEIAEKLDAINFYTYCCETIPSLIQAQEVIDRAKEKKEELLETFHGSKGKQCLLCLPGGGATDHWVQQKDHQYGQEASRTILGMELEKCSSVRGATAARSSSVTRLQTAASSSNTLQLKNKSQANKLHEARQLVDLLYAPAPPIEGPAAVDWACTRIIAVSGLLRHLDARGAEVFATQLVFRQLAESNDILVGRNVRTLNGLRRVMQEVLEEAEEIGDVWIWILRNALQQIFFIQK
ncbi:hypothetical protein GE061_001811 [Apolygus lucorum]|uniref:Uncharacterized protein n=1 Tax=Apolygus lucorum TaxID=248454 RepID=A0A8S9X2V9_APOLU|nr:hypothetical protein GE061_001811 [Apolygus lucorum]